MTKFTPLVLLFVTMTLAGCYNSALKGTYLEDTAIDRAPGGSVEEATALYQQGDFQASFEMAEDLAFDVYRDDYYEAAYIGGLSAQALGNLTRAEDLLVRAQRSPDQSLVVDASEALGLVYSQLELYEQAQQQLIYAAERLTGERQARAYYYAGIAQQKLGYWSTARTTLALARSLSADPVFRAQIDQQVAVTGWTLQVGAFADRERARTQAESIAQNASDLRLGLPRLVDGVSAEGQPLTYVYVGQFTSYQSAQRYRDALGSPGVIIRAMTP